MHEGLENVPTTKVSLQIHPPPPQQKYSSPVQKCAFLGRNWDKAGISQRATLWFNSIPTFDLLANTLI